MAGRLGANMLWNVNGVWTLVRESYCKASVDEETYYDKERTDSYAINSE
jgi:hypothetical protein